MSRQRARGMLSRAQRRTYLPPIPKHNLQPNTRAGAIQNTPADMGAIRATALERSFVSSLHLPTSASMRPLESGKHVKMLG